MSRQPDQARRLGLIWPMSVLLLSCVLLEATEGQHGTAQRDYEAITGKQVGTPPDASKVSGRLRAVMNEMQARGISRQNARELGAAALSQALVRVNEAGHIETYIYVATFGDAETEQLKAHEVSIALINEELGIIQAWIAFDRIDAVAQLPFVRRITAPSYGTPRVGSVTTEGDAILGAGALRAGGLDGRGVKVGVISIGANNRADAVATGDLPAGIDVFGSTCDSAFWGIVCDEGTAMLEIVYDLAPGAELGFGAVSTSLAFIRRVEELVDIFEADIIVDDIGFFDEPYFEDGPVARAVAEAVARGVVYVSAAGNQALGHYQAEYVDSGDAVNSHDFGGGETTLPIAGPVGEARIFLQWSNAFDTPADDYDLCSTDDTGTTTFFCSLDSQDGNDAPIRRLFLNCSNPEGCTGNIQIRRMSGSPQELEMFFGNTRPIRFNVSADSVFGHAAVSGVLATAAIMASDPGHDDIEPFSSRGPSTLFFPAQEARQKPDVAAIDGIVVTGTGGFRSPFFGTSAAAPHVAGIAALLKNLSPTATAAEIVAAIVNSAVDLGVPGPDNTFGAGRIDALAAAREFDRFPDGVINTPTDNVSINQGEAVHFTGTGTDPDGNVSLSFVWDFGGGASNSTEEEPGDVIFNTPGTFTVTFTVIDDLGLADPTPDTRTVTVNAAPDGVIDTPGAAVTINAGETVSFSGTGTAPDSHLPLSFLWDFDGGAPPSRVEDPGAVPFDTPGAYTVTFTVTDSLGLADPTPDTRTVTVNAVRRGGGGGGCTLASGARFDPTLVGILALMLAYLGWKPWLSPKITGLRRNQ
ncbi:hypothetical protein NKDENANG_02703 [Candidatus Entotheonellaceae bacterium PAL068K]